MKSPPPSGGGPQPSRRGVPAVPPRTKPAPAKLSLGKVYLSALAFLLGARVRTSQVRAALAASAEMIRLYWQIGRAIAHQLAAVGWDAGVIPRLAADLPAEFPETGGFSARNLKRMIAFYREYPDLLSAIAPQLAAQ